MRVAVTGATGFIGRKLVEFLIEKGDHVRILSRRPLAELQFPDVVSVHQADLTCADGGTLVSFVDGADVLYHAAGQLNETALMNLLHVEGTRRLLDASVGKVGRWVQLSSVGAYGPVTSGIVTEETPTNPIGAYECSKVQSDELVEHYAENGAFEYTILRPSNVFGPSMTNQSLFRLIGAIDRGLFFFIGKPGASANYIAIANVIDAIVRCGTMPEAKGRIYNISDHRNLEAFIHHIANDLEVSSPRLRLPEAPMRRISKLLSRLPHLPLTESRVNAMVNRCIYSTSRIEQELSYAHRLSMEDALGDLVRTWKQNQKNGFALSFPAS